MGLLNLRGQLFEDELFLKKMYIITCTFTVLYAQLLLLHIIYM